MLSLIYPFLILACAGFVAVLTVHISALAGSTTLFNELEKLFFPGLFVVWVPSILVMNRLTREFKQKDTWKAALRGCPTWMRRTLWIVVGYSWGAGMLILVFGGDRNSPLNSARAMSAIALTFYSVAVGILYSATRAPSLDRSRRCLNGHPLAPLAKFCDECGSPVAPDLVSPQR